MVLTARRTSLTPALIVPDEQVWTALGADPARLGAQPAFELRGVRRLLVSERLPHQLAEPVTALLAALPEGVTPEQHPLPLPGDTPLSVLLEQPSVEPTGHRASHGGDLHGGHDMHGGHDDMMAIVGEPSADGLVMDPIKLRLGPVATPLPSGLVAAVVLDGDVVAESAVEAVLGVAPSADSRPAPPDPLSPLAWTLVITAAAEAADGLLVSTRSRWLRLAAVELERALSHLAWLRSFARLLGWRSLGDACTSALGALHEPHGALAPGGHLADAVRPPAAVPEAVEAAHARAEAVAKLAGGHRLRSRTSGRGVLTPEQARARGLSGPVARACGLPDDVRADDPLYRQLGFEPVVQSGGDARARALVRTREALAALDLAAGALRTARGSASMPSPLVPGPYALVEGPRGPLRARRTDAGWDLAAPGAAAARAAAAAAMVGHEWATALVVLGSFDLSPWEISP